MEKYDNHKDFKDGDGKYDSEDNDENSKDGGRGRDDLEGKNNQEEVDNCFARDD